MDIVKNLKKISIFLLVFLVTCGPSEEEIQSRIDESVQSALSDATSTTVKVTTTTLQGQPPPGPPPGQEDALQGQPPPGQEEVAYSETYDEGFYYLHNSAEYQINNEKLYLKFRATWKEVNLILLHFKDMDKICTNLRETNIPTASFSTAISIQINQDVTNCIESSEILAIEIIGTKGYNNLTFYKDRTFTKFTFDEKVLEGKSDSTCCHNINFELLNQIFKELKSIYKNSNSSSSQTTTTTTTPSNDSSQTTTTTTPSTTTTTTVSCDSDTEPPQLVSHSYSPSSVDVTNSSATVEVLLNITDNCSGVGTGFYGVDITTDPSTGFSTASRISGTDTNGTWRATITIPQGSIEDTYSITLYPLGDNAENQGGFQSLGNFEVVNNTDPCSGDTEPPQLTGYSFSPSSVDTSSSSATVEVLLNITDNCYGVGTGFYGVDITTSPSTGFSTASRISGTDTNGTWRAVITIPQGSSGTYSITLYPLGDNGENQGGFQNLGNFEVTNGG